MNSILTWEALEDLNPLIITSTTDIAADWKLVDFGGGCETTETFCTLYTGQSSEVHNTNAEFYQHFSSLAIDDPNWQCCYHPIASSSCSSELQEEINMLKTLLLGDLNFIQQSSKIKYVPNPDAVS